MYVTTGGPIPSAFDTVLPVEETELLEGGEKIKVLKKIHKNFFIREKGSDIK